MERMHYRNLALMAVLSFISMYVLMYSMVNSFSNVFNSVNQFYMAGLMVAPMIVIELLLMGMMYENKLWNGLIIGGSIVLGILLFFLIRQQVAVGDAQFLPPLDDSAPCRRDSDVRKGIRSRSRN